MALLASDPTASDEQHELELLIREARRRQRRRRLATALLVLIAAGGSYVAILAASVSHRAGSRTASHASSFPSAASVLRGAATTVIVWPGSQCCDPLNTVDVDRLDTGRISLRRVPPMSGGDLPYGLIRVGTWLVYNGAAGDPGVAAIPDGLDGRPRVLRSAISFVPSAAPDQVWLVEGSPDNSSSPNVAQAVSVATGRTGPEIALPRGSELLAGTSRGLLLSSATSDLELWRSGHRAQTLAHLAGGLNSLFTAETQLVAYGASCRIEQAVRGKLSAGQTICPILRVIDLQSGRRLSVPAPEGTLGWEANGFGAGSDSPVSPGERFLALDAALRPARAGRTQLFVLTLDQSPTRLIAVPHSTSFLDTVATWSLAESWIFYDGQSTLWAFQITTGKSEPLRLRPGPDGIFALVSIPTGKG